MLLLRVRRERGSDGSEAVLCIPQSSRITGTSPSDCLVSYQDTRWGSLTPLQRCSQCILRLQLMDHRTLVGGVVKRRSRFILQPQLTGPWGSNSLLPNSYGIVLHIFSDKSNKLETYTCERTKETIRENTNLLVDLFFFKYLLFSLFGQTRKKLQIYIYIYIGRHVLNPFFKIARSTSPDEDFQLNQKFLYHNYFSYKNNFDKIILHSKDWSQNTLTNKQTTKHISFFWFTFSTYIYIYIYATYW